MSDQAMPQERGGDDVTDPRAQLTQMLREGGERREELLPLLYAELRDIARGRMHAERAGHTLQATALVHEAWMRLGSGAEAEWRDRGHFYSAASEAMRRVLVDHARRVKAEKRGGKAERVTLGAAEAQVEIDADRFLALDEALTRLAEEDPRAADVVRLRFLAGLSTEETAHALDLSVRSVHREWTFARARLFEMLEE